ncbi:MAG: hypothetical protein M3X11_00555 [Acidobacteriota bacterium]|nr:hypothetical protein [Acidobacteriota bacterium]
MKASVILAKINSFRLHPEWVDGPPLGGPGPGGPFFSRAVYEYALSGLLRDISPLLKNKSFGEKLKGVGKRMAEGSAKGLLAGWEPGDDICPPWPWPGPGPVWELATGPDPVPWLENLQGAMRDVVLAQAVREIASLTFDKEFSAEIKGIGEAIVREAQAKIFDDYRGTPVKPRVPKPKKAAKARK